MGPSCSSVLTEALPDTGLSSWARQKSAEELYRKSDQGLGMSNGIYVNGLPLPTALVRAVECGIWQTPKDRDAWRSLFPEQEIVQPLIYPMGEMQGQNSWLGIDGPGYLGHIGEGILPGDIDQSRAVLIADLGPDRLIALDYRESETNPSVIAQTSHEHSCWRRVADDIESFMRLV